MDSTVDCTFVTEGFSGAICKSKYSPKTLSDLLIINCVNRSVLCARFQESLGVRLHKGVWQWSHAVLI